MKQIYALLARRTHLEGLSCIYGLIFYMNHPPIVISNWKFMGWNCVKDVSISFQNDKFKQLFFLFLLNMEFKITKTPIWEYN